MIPRIIVLMGVSGSGKSIVGERLARELGAPFADADQFHPPENIAKMSRAIPLTDEDRKPWLERMRREVIEATPLGSQTVLACSALKRAYRDFLRSGVGDVYFVHLRGSLDLIASRILARQGHFMKRDLLESQFAALEEPEGEPNTLIVGIDRPIHELVAEVKQWLDGCH